MFRTELWGNTKVRRRKETAKQNLGDQAGEKSGQVVRSQREGCPRATGNAEFLEEEKPRNRMWIHKGLVKVSEGA